MEYCPDKWVMLKISSPTQTIYKVLAGWAESYLYGGSWKLNSGCIDVTDTTNAYMFKGNSGSVYNCRKHSYGLTVLTASILNTIMEKQKSDVVVELLPENTNFLSLDFNSVTG